MIQQSNQWCQTDLNGINLTLFIIQGANYVPRGILKVYIYIYNSEGIYIHIYIYIYIYYEFFLETFQ